MQIAITGPAFEVVVGVLDQAGSAHVLRFLRDGIGVTARGSESVCEDRGR